MSKNYKTKSIQVFLFILFYLLILCSSILFVAYLPFSYQLNYALQDQEYSEFQPYTNELLLYFLYIESLDDKWSKSEQLHYQDVRKLYSLALLLVIISLVVLIKCKIYINLKKYSIFSLVLLYSHFLLFIDFQFFWDRLFHPFLFSNSYWTIRPGELSYELFSYQFFINSIIFIILLTTFIHISIIFKDNLFNCYKKLWNHLK